jgi:hypothetical protein
MSLDNPICSFEMYITKSRFDTKRNAMVWNMVASDDQKDYFGEMMSLQLFNDFIQRIESEQPLPEEYVSVIREKSGWVGGLPYVSVSHYKSGIDGANIAGDVDLVYVDGNKLKAKGTFRDTELGRAVFKSVNEDIAGTSTYPEKTRVSIGFLDMEHSHGDMVFTRKSISDKCPMCENGDGDIQYLKGQLVHLAVTRIPANDRTDVDLEEKMAIKTKKEDAESIVGKTLAESLEVNKSVAEEDVLVVKSDIVEEPVVALVEEAKKEEPVAEDEEEDSEVCKACGGKGKIKKGMKSKSALDEAFETFSASVETLKSKGQDGLIELQPEFDKLGEVVKSQFETPAKVTSKETTMQDAQIFEIKALIQDLAVAVKSTADNVQILSNDLRNVKSEMEIVKSRAVTPTLQTPQIVKPRAFQPTERTAIPELKQEAHEGIPASIYNMVKKTVG